MKVGVACEALKEVLARAVTTYFQFSNKYP